LNLFGAREVGWEGGGRLIYKERVIIMKFTRSPILCHPTWTAGKHLLKGNVQPKKLKGEINVI